MHDSNAYRSAEFAEIYDAVYGDRDDAPFWNAMAATANDGPLLEIGCGTGRVLLPLARAGYEITGLDLSTHMIERCCAKLETEQREVRDRVTVLTADMTSFDLCRRFAMVISPFGGFHHLRTVEQQLSCLERCRAHLAPHGTLVLDLSNPDPVPAACPQDEPDDEEAAIVVDWTDGRRIRSWIAVVDYDRALQCNKCEMVCEVVGPDGSIVERMTQAFSLRYLFRYELEHLLVRAGFRLVALYGDYDRSPFAGDSPGMIAVAESLGAEPGVPTTGIT